MTEKVFATAKELKEGKYVGYRYNDFGAPMDPGM